MKLALSTVEKKVVETLALEEQVGRLLLQIDDNKKKIQKYFDENDLKQIRVETESKPLVCKKVERATVNYDVEKLKKALDDELFIEVTNRTYSIKDINEMVTLLKEAGIKAKKFKELVDVVVKPNRQAIKDLYDVGELTMKQLKGTFTATISKTIKITEEAGD